VAAIEHRDRGRGHHQRHHAVPDHRRQCRRDKGRLRGDLGQGAAAPRQIRRRRLRQVDEIQQHRRRQAQPDDHRIAAGEQHRREQVARPDRGLRAEHGRHDAAGQHQRYRLRAERLVGDLGRREPVLQREAVIAAEKERAEAEQREAALEDGGGRDRRAGRAEAQADPEAAPPPDARHQQRGRDRRRHHAGHLHRDRQGRERLVRGQHAADDRAGGADDAGAGHRQRLAAGQHQHGAT
jgi:hypothetical protein